MQKRHCLKLLHSFRSFGSESNQVGNRIIQTMNSLLKSKVTGSKCSIKCGFYGKSFYLTILLHYSSTFLRNYLKLHIKVAQKIHSA